MITDIQNFILPSDPNKIWFRVLLVLGIILIIIIAFKQINTDAYHEGFSQDSPFVVKRDVDIYDGFYVELYDKINQPEKQSTFIIEKVINMTQPSVKSVMLDVGSGTGHLTNELKKSGYQVYGIDKSQAMVQFCETQYPDVPIKCGDIANPMSYDRNTFTHIICTNMMIYHFKDKVEFFRNCYYWLLPNAYLILHLVDREKFDPIMSAGKPSLLGSPQKYSATRIVDTEIDFVDFKYKSSYDFANEKTVVLTETMTDGLSHHVRQNELTLYMENYNDILTMAQYCGFIVQGQVDMGGCIGDEHQYIFVLERTL